MRIIILIKLLLLLSCSVYSKELSKYKYYNEDFKLTSDSKLKTDGIYFREHNGLFDFIRFYEDGVFFSSYNYPHLLTKEDLYSEKGNWGFYKLENDGICFEVYQYAGLDSHYSYWSSSVGNNYIESFSEGNIIRHNFIHIDSLPKRTLFFPELQDRKPKTK